MLEVIHSLIKFVCDFITTMKIYEGMCTTCSMVGNLFLKVM
jgi:hypothetical protein